MKLRLVPVVALLTLAVTASAAYASATAPETGSWQGKGDIEGQNDTVRFTLKKAGDDDYRAASTRVQMVVGCDAPNPNDSTTAAEIEQRRVTVELKRSGNKLRGSRKVTRKLAGGKTTQTVRFTITFTSTRRAKVVVNASTKTKGKDVNPNAASCGGRLTVTAKPQ